MELLRRSGADVYPEFVTRARTAIVNLENEIRDRGSATSDVECYRGGCLVSMKCNDIEAFGRLGTTLKNHWDGPAVVLAPEPSTGSAVDTAILLLTDQTF